jgi:hypothetical protein
MASDPRDELYRSDPDEFVARRTALAKELATAGEKAAAKELRTAKRPTTAAWALNQLRDLAPDEVAQVAEVAAAWAGERVQLQEAGADGGSDMRGLMDRKRALVRALLAQARLVLADTGRASDAVERQVADTLDAALVDPEVAALLAAGQLVTATRATGLEGMLAPDRPAVSGSAPAKGAHAAKAGPSKSDEVGDELQRRREAKARAAEEARAKVDADLAAAAAEEAYAEAQDRLTDAEADLAAAQTEVADLQAELERARSRASESRRAVSTARGQLAAAERRRRP